MSYANSTKKKQGDSVLVMCYDDFEEIHDRVIQGRRNRAARDRENRAKYYSRQRVMGLVIALIGIICLIVGCNIGTEILESFGAIVGCFGIYVVVTKQMILVDKYYLEFMDRAYDY